MVMVPVGIQHTIGDIWNMELGRETWREGNKKSKGGIEERGRERRRGMKGRERKIDSGKCVCIHE